MKKKCHVCKKVKDINCFYKNKTRPDGHDYRCKDCEYEYHDKRRKETSIYFKKYKENNKDKMIQISKKSKKTYNMKYPERIKAKNIANRNKNILKKSFCEYCGMTEDLQMHHPDYSKPLAVVTLCRQCHMKLSRKYIKPQEDVRVKIAILLHDEFDEVMDVRVMTYYQDIANKILAIVKGG